jgi:hypothetical protein
MQKPNGYYKKLRDSPAPIRVAIGVLLIVAGLLGFLPILGFWMLPLGLVVIFIDAPRVKRGFSRLRKSWRRFRQRRTESL